MTHTHEWKFICHALAEFPKRNLPEKRGLFGAVEACSCNEWRIIPDQANFGPISLYPPEKEFQHG